jgi:predicted enzyme related to lactoylglutathione lyase
MPSRRAVRIASIAAAAAVLAGCRIERNPPAAQTRVNAAADSTLVRGVRTVIYHVPDLSAAKDWYARLLEQEPYFDEPFYVGFQVAGYELGLDPDTTLAAPGVGGSIAYWGVTDVDLALSRALALGATRHEDVQQVGGGVRTASVLDPFGNVIGFIDNPNFRVPPR